MIMCIDKCVHFKCYQLLILILRCSKRPWKEKCCRHCDFRVKKEVKKWHHNTQMKHQHCLTPLQRTQLGHCLI